jgi:hypothetical protein
LPALRQKSKSGLPCAKGPFLRLGLALRIHLRAFLFMFLGPGVWR